MAREIAEHIIIFPDGARSIAGDETRRDVNQTGPLHAFGERDHVLRADNIRAQGALQGWIESYVTGRVDDDVDVAGDLPGLFIAEAKIVVRDVAADDLDFAANESVERAAISLAERIERRRRDHVIPKARLGFFLRTRADGNVHAPDVRKAMQQHAQRDLAKKARAAYQKHLPVFVDFSR